MARYKRVDYSQGQFIPIQFERQILPGTFEHALNYVVDKKLSMSAFDEKRKDLVPITRKHSVAELAGAMRRHADVHGGPVNLAWVLMAVAVQNNPRKSLYLVSVSATSNPLGVWRNYALDAMRDGNTPTNNWADFPALGVDNKALYITSNQFAFNGGFQFAKIRVVPKAGPYSGGAAPFFDFVRMRNANNALAFTVQPCHTFGAP